MAKPQAAGTPLTLERRLRFSRALLCYQLLHSIPPAAAAADDSFGGCLAAIARHAKSILGVDVHPTGVPLYTDARHYAAAGIPVVLYGAGPRSILEANAHNADENLRLDDLRAATKIVALAVADLMGAA